MKPAPADYERLWQSVAIPIERMEKVKCDAVTVLRGMKRYEAVGAELGIPWWWIGCLHMRECSCSFALHLHNGDPLTHRTVGVPAGRPLAGKPPFKWEVSAIDALTMEGFAHLADWSIGAALQRAEGYNGWGYAGHGIRSPYVWAATTLQQRGKYTTDHGFDPTIMDKQIGVAALAYVLTGLGVQVG